MSYSRAKMKYIRASIRFSLFVVSTIGLYAFWFVLAFFIPNKQYWRQIIMGSWARSFAWISGMELEVIGRPPEPPFLLVGNHVGYIDICSVRAVATGVFVAKHDIADWPLAGRMITDMGNIFINRSLKRDIPRAAAGVEERLNGGEGVIIFPEGTSTKGDEVLPFNSSFLDFAARTDMPVSYVSISYRTAPGEPPASESIAWWDDTPFLKHMLNLFAVRRFTCTLTFGDTTVASPNRKHLATELTTRVRERFIPML